MRRRYNRSIFDELDELRAYMDSMFRNYPGPSWLALPAAETERGVVPFERGELRVDVTEHDDEVIVTADMIPGVAKKDITLDLIRPQALEIRCERKEERKEEEEGFYMRERNFGSLARIIPLPSPVTEKGASATFKNGVLEVHLKKSEKERVSKIPIE
jgi:HSP20 family protein